MNPLRLAINQAVVHILMPTIKPGMNPAVNMPVTETLARMA